MLFIKKPKNKKFDYSPRYYRPELDEEERKKRKLNFRSELKVKKGKSPLFYLVFLILVIYALIRFSKVI